MRRMLWVIGVMLAAVGPAGAQVDPDPDGIGIYADPAGSMNSLDATVGSELSLYILATNISEAGGIASWQLRVIADSPDVVLLEMDYPYAATEQCGLPGPDKQVSVDGDALTQAPIIHLANLNLVVVGSGPVELFLDNSSCSAPELPPSYITHDPVPKSVRLTPSSGSVEAPVFRINGLAPVANGKSTWGAVKSLYR